MNKAFVLPVVTGLAGLAVGSLMSGVISRSAHAQFFRTHVPVFLFTPSGTQVGMLPVGTPVMSGVKLPRGNELGWWGYVPIYFGTTKEAMTLLQKSQDDQEHIYAQITLNGLDKQNSP